MRAVQRWVELYKVGGSARLFLWCEGGKMSLRIKYYFLKAPSECAFSRLRSAAFSVLHSIPKVECGLQPLCSRADLLDEKA